MRLLLHDASTGWSGRARAFFAAARVLVARGYDVTVACPAGSPLESRCRDRGWETEPVRPAPTLAGRIRDLRRVVRDRFLDAVFVHNERDDLAASVAVRLAGRGAVVRRLAAGDLPVTGWRTRLARRFAPGTFLFTGTAPPDGVTWPRTEVVRGDLGIESPTGPRVLASVTDRGAPRLACIASPAARPHVLNVLRTVALLAERHPRVHLALGGTGLPVDDLRLQAAALRIAPMVEIRHGEDDLLRSCDVVWVTADGDEAAFGCLAGMARSLPVFAPRTQVTERFITSGVHGELFPALQPPVLAATLARYAAHPARLMRAGRAARDRAAREFTERDLANGFEQAARVAHERATVSR